MIVAFVGAVVVWVTYRPHWDATDDAATKLAVFATGPEIRSTGSNLVTEIVGTGVLVFGVLAIAANAGEMTAGAVDLSSVFATGLNPLLVGLLVWSIGLSLGGPTGYASTPLATSDRGSPMRCCRSPARAAPTGAMVGYRWPDRWSAVCSVPWRSRRSAGRRLYGASRSGLGSRHHLEPLDRVPPLESSGGGGATRVSAARLTASSLARRSRSSSGRSQPGIRLPMPSSGRVGSRRRSARAWSRTPTARDASCS